LRYESRISDFFHLILIESVKIRSSRIKFVKIRPSRVQRVNQITLHSSKFTKPHTTSIFLIEINIKNSQKFITILKKLSHINTLSSHPTSTFIYFPIKSQKIFRNLSLIHHHNLPVAHFSVIKLCDNTAGISFKFFEKLMKSSCSINAMWMNQFLLNIIMIIFWIIYFNY